MSTAKHLRGPFAYTCHVCKVEFYDGRTRRQDTCKAEFCQRERHRIYQLAKNRAQGRPVKFDVDALTAMDEKAEAVWVAKFQRQELDYHGVSAKQQQEWLANQAARVVELRQGMGL